jgi:hypothetical protein
MESMNMVEPQQPIKEVILPPPVEAVVPMPPVNAETV